MAKPGKYFYRVGCIRDKLDSSHGLFDTEIRGFPLGFSARKICLMLEDWRRELELLYFPEHKLILDEGSWSVIQLSDGLRIVFHLRET